MDLFSFKDACLFFFRLEEDSEGSEPGFFPLQQRHYFSLQTPLLLFSYGFAKIPTGYMPVTTLNTSYFVG